MSNILEHSLRKEPEYRVVVKLLRPWAPPHQAFLSYHPPAHLQLHLECASPKPSLGDASLHSDLKAEIGTLRAVLRLKRPVPHRHSACPQWSLRDNSSVATFSSSTPAPSWYHPGVISRVTTPLSSSLQSQGPRNSGRCHFDLLQPAWNMCFKRHLCEYFQVKSW